MPEYLWTAKDKLGNPVAERIFALTVEQAKAELESQGYSDLQLHTDVAIAEVFHEEKLQFSAQDQVRFQYAGPVTFGEAWGRSYKEAKITTAILLAVSMLSWLQGHYLIATVCTGWLLVFPAIDLWLTQSSRCYAQLNKAKVWHRWGEVLALAARLRRLKRWTRIGPSETELVRSCAQALAGLGQVDEALKMLGSLEGDPKTPRWLYLSFRAGILDIAKRHPEAVMVNKEALKLKPDFPALLIDLAIRIARFEKDYSEAKALLSQAEREVLSEMTKPFVALGYGVAAWHERDFSTARIRLQQALTAFDRFRQNPLVEASVMGTKAYLCCVEGAAGNLTEARRLFCETKEYLEATHETELLHDCRAAVRAA